MIADNKILTDVFGKRYGGIPTSPLRVDTTTRSAQVIQDDLANSSSLQSL